MIKNDCCTVNVECDLHLDIVSIIFFFILVLDFIGWGVK